jgi:hypothetical protein
VSVGNARTLNSEPPTVNVKRAQGFALGYLESRLRRSKGRTASELKRKCADRAIYVFRRRILKI